MSILDKIIKGGLYLVAFLVPIFFLPVTVSPVGLNKQLILGFLGLGCLDLWLIKVFLEGKLRLNLSKTSILALVFILLLAASTGLSQARNISFWGSASEPDTLFNFLLFGLVFFLFSNLLSNRQEVLRAMSAFLASSAILSLFFLIQAVLKKPIFPWDFSRFITFNPIGTVQALGLFLGGAFAVSMALFFLKIGKIKKKWALALVALLNIFLFLSVAIINYWPIWLAIALCLVIIMAEMSKSIDSSFGRREMKKFIFPALLLIISFVFAIIKPSIQNFVVIAPEANPSLRLTLDIAVKTLKESIKNLFFGSGPATWVNQFSLYRWPILNSTDFWQVRFSQGASILSTFLATAGVLGCVSAILMIGYFALKGLKSVFKQSEHLDYVELMSFIGSFYFFLLWFLYPLNFTLCFAGFLMLGLWLAVKQEKISEFSFQQSPQKAFLTMMACAVLVIGSCVGLWKISRNYRGAISYAQGLELIYQENPDLDAAIQKISQAISFAPRDIYLRDLSEVFLMKINQIINSEELSNEAKREMFQQAMSNMETAIMSAQEIYPQNSQNWFQSGKIYESLLVLGVENAEESAIANYKKAKELDPQNSQITLNMGGIYKFLAQKAKGQMGSEEKDLDIEGLERVYRENFDLALENLKESIALKPNLSFGYFYIAQLYEIDGDKEMALAYYDALLRLEPNNQELIDRIQELREGAEGI